MCECVSSYNSVCPSAGDTPPYLSKSQRMPGGQCLRAAEESSPATSGNLLPLGTVRCCFYDCVLNAEFFSPWWTSLHFHLCGSKCSPCLDLVFTAPITPRLISVSVADASVGTTRKLCCVLMVSLFATVPQSSAFCDTAVLVLHCCFLVCTMNPQWPNAL